MPRAEATQLWAGFVLDCTPNLACGGSEELKKENNLLLRWKKKVLKHDTNQAENDKRRALLEGGSHSRTQLLNHPQVWSHSSAVIQRTPEESWLFSFLSN